MLIFVGVFVTEGEGVVTVGFGGVVEGTELMISCVIFYVMSYFCIFGRLF